MDNKTEIARFSHDGISEDKSGGTVSGCGGSASLVRYPTVTWLLAGELADMMIIVRELKGGPPNCE